MSEANVYCIVLSRREDVTHERFLHCWLVEHRRLIERLPHLIDIQLLPVAEPTDGGPDGVGLLFFAGAAEMAEALASDAAQELRRHTATFARSDQALRLLLVAG